MPVPERVDGNHLPSTLISDDWPPRTCGGTGLWSTGAGASRQQETVPTARTAPSGFGIMSACTDARRREAKQPRHRMRWRGTWPPWRSRGFSCRVADRGGRRARDRLERWRSRPVRPQRRIRCVSTEGILSNAPASGAEVPLFDRRRRYDLFQPSRVHSQMRQHERPESLTTNTRVPLPRVAGGASELSVAVLGFTASLLTALLSPTPATARLFTAALDAVHVAVR